MNRRNFIQSLLAVIPASLLNFGNEEYKYPWDVKGPMIRVTRKGPLSVWLLEDAYQSVTWGYNEPSLLVMGKDHYNWYVKFFKDKGWHRYGRRLIFNNCQVSLSRSMPSNESIFINEKLRDREKYNISITTI